MRELKFNVFTEFGMFKNVSIHGTGEFGISNETFFKTAKKPIDREEDDWDDLLCEFNFMDCGEDWMQGEGIIAQYTGLKDKSGVEIYEGDIVQFLYKHPEISEPMRFAYCEIVWHDEGAWCLRWPGKQEYLNGARLNPGNYEIIGNIHLNPNLL